MSISAIAQINHRRPSADRQMEIVEAVLALAAERGVEAITTALIAERLGLSQGAVFRHFPNKEAIWAAVLGWLSAHLSAIFQRHSDDPWVELERIFHAYMRFFAEYPAMPRLVFSDTFHHAYPALHQAVGELVATCEGRLKALIEEAAEHGIIPRNRDASVAAKLLITCIQGLAFQSAILGLVADPRRAGPPLFQLWRQALIHEEIHETR